jgi:Rieske Fe-S protein
MASELTRREILWMSALAAAAFVPIGSALAASVAVAKFDAGKLARYADDAVYPDFRNDGFFVIRRRGRVFAQSSICTHKGSKLTPLSDGFVCKTHNSAFSLDGKVTRPPARQNLVRYQVSIENDHLMVDLTQPLKTEQFDSTGAYVTTI